MSESWKLVVPLEAFQAQCVFCPKYEGYVGVELEGCVYNLESGRPVPEAWKVLQEFARAEHKTCFGAELSACQIELRTPPVATKSALMKEVHRLRQMAEQAARKHGLGILYADVAPEDMPLEVTSRGVPADVRNRYQRIAQSLSRDRLSAACRVMGLHVHVGTSAAASALNRFNNLVPHTESLERRGDCSQGERLRLYERVKSHSRPRVIRSWADLYRIAGEEGFRNNLRDWWWRRRITRFGTIEDRCAGSFNTVAEVVEYAWDFRELCMQAEFATVEQLQSALPRGGFSDEDVRLVAEGELPVPVWAIPSYVQLRHHFRPRVALMHCVESSGLA